MINGVSTITDYLGGYQYKNAALEFFPHAEGYVKNTSGMYSYVFNYTDHLGNVRVSYSDLDKDGSIDKTKNEILEESNYYPFGLKHEPNAVINKQPNYKYKYNGKELQDELGLNMYDYGARLYDPARAGWSNIDPLAENSRRWSPYNYCYNNPIRFIDPDGMQATYDWKTGKYMDGNKEVSFSDAMASHGMNEDGSENNGETPPDDYVFNEKGEYVRTDKTGSVDRLVVEDSKTGFHSIYRFSDPVNDPKQIKSGIINKLRILSKEQIVYLLRIQGAFMPSLKDNIKEFYYRSKGGRSFDFSYTVIPEWFSKDGASSDPLTRPSSVIFAAQGSNFAYNHMNFGNFLWGVTGATLGFDTSTLQSGAHFNSIFNSRSNGYSPQWDSDDDQGAIIQGTFYAKDYNFGKIK